MLIRLHRRRWIGKLRPAGQSAKDLEITFERFLASLYMTGMLQLGLMRQQGGAAATGFDWGAADD